MSDKALEELKEELEEVRWLYQNYKCGCNPYEEKFLTIQNKIDELESVQEKT